MKEMVVEGKRSWASRLAEDVLKTTCLALVCAFVGLAFVGETQAEGIEAFWNNFACVYALRAIGQLVAIVLEVDDDS